MPLCIVSCPCTLSYPAFMSAFLHSKLPPTRDLHTVHTQSIHQPHAVPSSTSTAAACDIAVMVCDLSKGVQLTVSGLAHSNNDELVCSIHGSTSACTSYICDHCKCYSTLFRSSKFTDQNAVEVQLLQQGMPLAVNVHMLTCA